VELRDRGVVPTECTNHGPTTSIYYADPDGNRVELLYDNFEDPSDAQRFIESETFRKNPMGLRFDPEQLLRNAKAGVPVSRLIAYEALP
jgi:catechol-2,3-dioxygenase